MRSPAGRVDQVAGRTPRRRRPGTPRPPRRPARRRSRSAPTTRSALDRRPGGRRPVAVEAVRGQHRPLGHRRPERPRSPARRGARRARRARPSPSPGRPHQGRGRPAPPLGIEALGPAQADEHHVGTGPGRPAGPATWPTLAVKPWRRTTPGRGARAVAEAGDGRGRPPASSSGPSGPATAGARRPPGRTADHRPVPTASHRRGPSASRSVLAGPSAGPGRAAQVGVPLLPAGHGPQEVGEAVEVGADLRAVLPAEGDRPDATSSRSARRTTVRATSRAADRRFCPGDHEFGRHRRCGR